MEPHKTVVLTNDVYSISHHCFDLLKTLISIVAEVNSKVLGNLLK